MANNDLTSADAWESATNDYLKNHAAQVGSSLYSAANVNPDKAARAQAVGRSLGIPASSAMAYPDETERQVKLQEANPQGIVTTSPVLAQHLTDQNTANIMHDDIPNASGIEQALRTQKPAQNGLLADIGVGLKSSANQIFGALGNSLGHMSVLEGVNNYAKSLGLKDGLGLSEYLQEAQKPLDDTYTKSLRDGAVNGPNRWTGNLASGLAYAPFGPAAPGVAALTSKEEAKQSLTDQGVDAQTAEGVSNAQGIVQGGAFLLPMGQFAFGAGARALAKSAAQAAVKSGAAGASQSVIGDSVAQQILEKNGYGDLAKQYAPTFEKAWDSALFMAGAHLGMQGVHGVLTRRPPMPAELVQESINAQNSEHDSQVINAVGDAAATSKWRVRDHDTQSSFKQFVGDAAQGTGHESIYIEGKTFEQALDKEGISPDELRALMPDVAKQMNESLQTDGYVRVPMEDYATHMAGTELDKGLRDHMKLDPDSMTTHERQAFYQGYQERMKEDALKAISEQSTIDEFQASRDRVRDQVQKELAATGRYPSDIGKTNATIKAAIVARIAAAQGISPEEAYKRHGAKIVSEPIKGGFEQSSEGPFGKIFTEHHHDVEGAIASLSKEKGGEAVGALHHPKIGDIDLVWGKEGKNEHDGYGLSKLLKWHPEVVGDLQNIVASMEITKQSENRINLESKDHKAGVRLQWDGVSKKWLLTAFEKDKKSGESKPSTDTSDIGKEDDSLPNATDAIVEQDLNKYYQSKGARGSYEPESKTIALLKDADLSTFNHEVGHWALDTYSRLATDNPVIKGEMDHLLKWFGVDSLEKWNGMSLDEQRPYHEQFAKGFETYLMEGKAPSIELQPIFARIKQWMISVYQSLDKLGVPLTDEVRGVYQRMMASEEAIRQAESARVFEPLFKDKPQGVSDSEWSEYQSLGQEATDQAVSDMQAKSLRDMKWLRGAKSRALKEVQKQEASARREVKMQVTKEVMSQPVYRAWTFLTARHGDLVEGKPTEKKSRDAIDPENDDLFTAIAKLGGLSHEAVEHAWGVSEGERKKMESGVFGKPVVRKTGGLEIDEMAERLAREGYLTEDEHGKSDIAEFEEAFDAQRRGTPRYSMARDMRDAYGSDWQHIPDLPDMGYGKLRTEDLRYLFGEGKDEPWRKLSKMGMTSDKIGLDADVISEMIGGFNSGKGMVKALIEAEHPSQVINGLTDRRMLEQHGELATPQAIDDAANAAIHNDARARFVATGLKVLAKSAIPVRDLVKGAKEAAESAIGSKKVGETSPRQYEVAEAKANRQALKDVAKDPKAAVQSQRASLLNNQLAKAARDANAKEVKIVNYLKRFDKPSIAEKLPGSFLEQINAIRDQFDFRQIQTASNRPRENLIKWAEGLRDAGYEPQIADWLAESAQRKHYKELTNNELAGVYDTVRSIEATAKNFREITRNGERVALDGVVDELIAKMDERGEKFTKQDLIDKPNAKTDGKWKAITHWMGVHLRKVDADLLPQEFKINHYDLHDLEGPFREVLFNPVVGANYAKADMTKAVSDAAAKVGEELGKDWQKAMFDLVDNQSLVDPRLASEGSPAPLMKITRAKLLGIMRHLGNESNFDKLTSGYGWEPKAVWDFVMKNATEKDWKATQAHWDSFEPLWAKTEEMIRRIGGVPAPKIPAREFDTPYGKMRGGYSPIDYDPVASKLSERKGEFDLAPGDKVAGENMVYKATTTSNSSMISRSHGYTDYVNLDLHSADARIRDTIHDLAYREALLDTTKVLNNSKFREKFQLTYGKEEYQAMTDWYKNIRDTYLINSKDRGFENALQYTRQGVVLTGIAYRLSTVLKHGSGAALKSLGYLGNAEGAKYFAARVARMSSGHMREEIAGAKEKFAEIRTRMLQMDRDYKQGNRTMLEAEGWREKNDRFGHAMVAWSDALSAIPTAWAAYDLALTSGVPKSMGGNGKPMSEEAAVKYANSVVRQAHGSALEVTRSNFMQSKGVKGLFGTLYGFMNNSYGQTRDMYSKAFQGGAFENNPALVARALAAVVIPGVVAGYASHGGPSEDESWYGWALKSIAGEVAGMVPFVRDAASMLEYGQGGDIAPMRVLKDGYLVGKDVVKEVNGEDSKIIRDLANFIGEVAHIGGLGQGGKTLQYLRDVANGKENPEGAGEFIHDAALGPKHH